MKASTNPLRQMVLLGKARTDFFEWYRKTYSDEPLNVDLWSIASKLEHFSAFFGKTIVDANDFYHIQDQYNK